MLPARYEGFKFVPNRLKRAAKLPKPVKCCSISVKTPISVNRKNLIVSNTRKRNRGMG